VEVSSALTTSGAVAGGATASANAMGRPSGVSIPTLTVVRMLR
jgi:hypothetical protein